ncbi:MAG: DAK2 domain-containing protein [Chloroflexota bacterium]|nr:DAK2 domain-containing protein [Chloroflexota bacterium]
MADPLHDSDPTDSPDTPPSDGPWSGRHLKRAMHAASRWLDRHVAGLNALNVFPVPDGDTGTNMTLTMQAACKQVEDADSESATEISAGMSHGALMGARGNSGVIFSQVLRGFHRGLAGAERVGSSEWALGMREGATAAYQAVLKPVEGTMLTVIREMADGAEAAAAKGAPLRDAIAATVEAGRASVARTPQLLQKLREAGVVDAGGQGLFLVFEGILRFARGEAVEGGEFAVEQSAAELAPDGVHVAHGEYGYCTNFILVGQDLDFPTVRAWIADHGDSVVVVGDNTLIKVHVHTERPGEILNYACDRGNLRQVAVTDMQEQHDEFIEMHGGGPLPPTPSPTKGGGVSSTLSSSASSGEGSDESPLSAIGTLAVVAGAGMAQAFRSMGASALVEGGQTMNPSTQDLLAAVERLPHAEVIILPNNGNIVMAANQVQDLTTKRVVVVPTDSLPQGMAALVAFNYEADLDNNVSAMQQAAAAVESGEITTAVRDVTLNGLSVRTGDVIGLHNGALVAVGPSEEAVATQLLDAMGTSAHDLVTLYYGADVTAAAAEAFGATVQAQYPDQEVEVVAGGQPFYAYIIAVE